MFVLLCNHGFQYLSLNSSKFPVAFLCSWNIGPPLIFSCSLLFSVVLCCSLLFSVVLCCSLLFSVVLCCSLLFSVVLCSDPMRCFEKCVHKLSLRHLLIALQPHLIVIDLVVLSKPPANTRSIMQLKRQPRTSLRRRKKFTSSHILLSSGQHTN